MIKSGLHRFTWIFIWKKANMKTINWDDIIWLIRRMMFRCLAMLRWVGCCVWEAGLVSVWLAPNTRDNISRDRPRNTGRQRPDYCQPDQLLSGDTSTPTQTVSSSSFTRKPIIEWERLKSWGDGRLNIKTSLSNIASIENILHQLTKTIPFPQSSPPVVLSRPLWGKSREKQIYL